MARLKNIRVDSIAFIRKDGAPMRPWFLRPSKQWSGFEAVHKKYGIPKATLHKLVTEGRIKSRLGLARRSLELYVPDVLRELPRWRASRRRKPDR